MKKMILILNIHFYFVLYPNPKYSTSAHCLYSLASLSILWFYWGLCLWL